ncbi:MAG: MarR family transcriptional regulator [Pseudomonadota bacterium]
MSNITHKNAGKQPFMGVVRELVAAYQAFTLCDATGLRRFDLTPPQADVLFTLGNTEGMTFKEIGKLTLITKGTLTGVVDRLEGKGMVKRMPGHDDRRCTRVVLTAKGTKLFQTTFPRQIAYLKGRFDRLSASDCKEMEHLLKKLKSIF